MKIRTDFVTNSSSSSFVVFGIRVDEILSDEEKEEIDNVWDYLEEKLRVYNEDGKRSSLTYAVPYGEPEYATVGMTMNKLLQNYPDSKIVEIKKIVIDEINRVFDKHFRESDIDYIEESSYDG